jgi:hypothetical protein
MVWTVRTFAATGERQAGAKPCYPEKGIRDAEQESISDDSDAMVSELSDEDAPSPAEKDLKAL